MAEGLRKGADENQQLAGHHRADARRILACLTA
jgi:hypothetical protein